MSDSYLNSPVRVRVQYASFVTHIKSFDGIAWQTMISVLLVNPIQY